MNTKTKKMLLIAFLGFIVVAGFISSCSKRSRRHKSSDVEPQVEVEEQQYESPDSEEDDDTIAKLQKENSILKSENTRLTQELQRFTQMYTSSSENGNSNPNTQTSVVQMEESGNVSLETHTNPENLYLSIKFWEDGKNYQLYDNSNWYTDPYLSQKGSGNPVIVSPMGYELELENGQTVYHVMSSNGLIYMTDYPDLEEIESSEILHAPITEAANEAYLALLFYKDGSLQQLYEDSEQSWYDDCYLSHQIPNSTEIRVTSVHTDCITLKNNVEVYSALAENGTVLWMNEYPDLETLE